MNRSPAVGRAVLAAAILVLAQSAAVAQTSPPKPPPPVTKAPPRLPPNASETSRIPAGVDTGTSATRDTMPLGTPIPPALGADRNEIKTRSAAARAAARPKIGASAADCARRPAGDPVAVGKTSPGPAGTTTTTAPPATTPGAASTTVLRTAVPDC